MNYLLRPIAKNLFKQKATYLLLAISLFPLLLIIASLIDTNFMQLSGEQASISTLDFIAAILSTQHQFIFPFIILAYIAATLFYDEISSGRLTIFKDISKVKVLSAKRMSLFLVFISYVILIALTTSITYFVYINQLPIATNTFFPLEIEETRYLIIEILGLLLTEIIGLSIALTASIYLTGGYTILITIFYQLLSMMAPGLNTVRYFFPTGYKTLTETIPFMQNILAILVVTSVFLILSKLTAVYMFKRIEY